MLERMWRRGNLLSLLVEMQTDTATVEAVWSFLKKLGVKLWYDPTIPLLGYPEKIIIVKDTCTPMFLAALFTVGRTWNNLEIHWQMIWVKKLWYIYTMAMLNFLSLKFKTYKETSISSTSSLYVPTIQLQKWCSHDQSCFICTSIHFLPTQLIGLFQAKS